MVPIPFTMARITHLLAQRTHRAALAAAALALLTGAAVYDPPIEASHYAAETLTAAASYPAFHLTPQPAPQRLSSDLSDTGLMCVAGEPAPLDANAFTYRSEVIAAPRWFNAVAFNWRGDLPAGARVLIDVRTSDDALAFTPWMRADDLDALRGSATTATDLVFSPGRYLQYQVGVEDAPEGWQANLDGVNVTYIDSTHGPSANDAARTAGGSVAARLMALVRPQVIGRAGWGADERIRFDHGDLIWPPQYAPVKKLIIHHTASPNGPEDPAAVVRAIYQYHTVSRDLGGQGWGDIGYNFLIDPNGRVYEGRTGGRYVIGAHALQYNKGSVGVAMIGNFEQGDPNPQAAAALERFVLAKAVEFGIDPKGGGFFIDKDMPNIVGHRDAGNTACPGASLYAMLPGLRDRTKANLPPLGQSFQDVKPPKVFEPGVVAQVDVTVRNSGLADWTLGLKDPIRVGYHWLTADGQPYQEATELEVHTDLPKTVAAGDTVVLKAAVRTPTKTGRYVLRWDMLQERVTWFETQGNTPYDTNVVVFPAATMPNDQLVLLPNDLLVLAPVERLRTLPLSRLTLLENQPLLDLAPQVISLLTNERVLSFSNDILLKYLPDARLITFSMDRISTFPLEVQVRLGFAPQAAVAPAPAAPVAPAPPMSTDPGRSKAP